MKAADHRICPACGARNRTQWDFCIRCGESLQGVARAKEAAPAAVTRAAESEATRDSGTLSAAFVVVGIVLVGAGGYWSWRNLRTADAPARPNPGVFVPPTAPVGPPKGAPARTGPGVNKFDEGRRLLTQGDTAGAVSLLAEAVAEAPSDPLYRATYAVALEANHMGEDALREFATAARLAPELYTGVLARALDRAGKKAEALQAYESALSLRPSDHELARDAANMFLAAGRADRALPLLKQAAASDPHDMAVQQYLGWAVEQSGSLTEAAEIYTRILEKLPEAEITRGRLAEVLFKQGQKDQAISLVQEGVQRSPESPLLHRGLAGLLERAGRDGEAAAEYREYARLAPNADDAKTYAERAQKLERRSAAKRPS